MLTSRCGVEEAILLNFVTFLLKTKSVAATTAVTDDKFAQTLRPKIQFRHPAGGKEGEFKEPQVPWQGDPRGTESPLATPT